MGVRQKDYNPANGLALLKLALGEKEANETTPGRVPSGIAQNAYFSSMPNTNEQEREAKSYDELDRGASERYQAGLDQNKEIDLATSGAHAMGFDSPRAQMEDSAMKKLRMVLAPEQMKLDAASAGADEARTYAGMEHERDRQARADLVRDAQSGQTQRNADTLAQRDKQFQQLHPPGLLQRMKEAVFGKSAAPAGPNASGSAEPTVRMESPDGQEQADVPQSQVQAFIARGGKVIQ